MASSLRFESHVTEARNIAEQISGSRSVPRFSWINLEADADPAYQSDGLLSYIFADGLVADDEPPTHSALQTMDTSDVLLADALISENSQGDSESEDSSTFIHREGTVKFTWRTTVSIIT